MLNFVVVVCSMCTYTCVCVPVFGEEEKRREILTISQWVNTRLRRTQTCRLWCINAEQCDVRLAKCSITRTRDREAEGSDPDDGPCPSFPQPPSLASHLIWKPNSLLGFNNPNSESRSRGFESRQWTESILFSLCPRPLIRNPTPAGSIYYRRKKATQIFHSVRKSWHEEINKQRELISPRKTSHEKKRGEEREREIRLR